MLLVSGCLFSLSSCAQPHHPITAKNAIAPTSGHVLVKEQPSNVEQNIRYQSNNPLTVVLDAGHTNQRGGAMSATGIAEHLYNLALTDAIAERLTQNGVRILRTGNSAADVSLLSRVRDTGRAKLFISIHHDSMQQSWLNEGRQNRLKGYAIFVSKKNPFWQQSLSCADHLGDDLQQAGERPSLYHATPIKGENRPLLDRGRGIHQFDDLIVLKNAKSPAVLVEAGVIVNPKEAVRLRESVTVNHLADAVATGIEQCLKP